MTPSPLQLEQHFFSKICLDVNADGQSNVDNILHCEIEVGRAEDNAKRFQVIFRLKLQSPSEKKAPYTGEIHAVGLFRVLDVWPEDQIDRLVEANGSAVLYGAIRELVLNLTARGPWPAVRLNTFTFIPPKESSGVARGAGTKHTPAAPGR
jgi:preprotein translocase subunit SecB